MKVEKINEKIVYYNSFKYDESWHLKEYIYSDYFKDFCDNLEKESIIVLGWDWTMLKAVKDSYKKWLPFIWINFWNKWFLLNDKDFITKKSKFVEKTYSIMECEIESEDKKYKDIFINEANITASLWKMLDLDIKLWDKNRFNLKWDWVIISSSLWSTWYNSSLWWAIISHNLDALSITPKAPWEPRWKNPIVVDIETEVSIENKSRYQWIEIYTDSRRLYESDDKYIKIKINKSKYNLRLLIEEKYQNIWEEKLINN